MRSGISVASETFPMRFSWRPIACSAVIFASAFLMIGCSVAPVANQSTMNPVQTPTPTPSTVTLGGVIHGGQNPLNNAQVYLLAARQTGYGQQSRSLITGGLTGGINNWDYVTTSNGIFTIPGGTYSCNQGEQVYLYAKGGDAGFGTNSDIGLMAVLGVCGATNNFPNLYTTSGIQMNEVTTVAAAYALAGFAADATDISSPNTSLALTGIANAALNAASLADLGSGLPPANTASGGVVPQEMINTVANILAACINTQTPSTGGCNTLVQNATSNGTGTGTPPGDTATAAINIAHYPGANVGALFGAITSTPPFLFSPQLTSAPTDFAIGIGYSGGGLTAPTAIAIDVSGNAWVADTPGGGAGGVIVLGPQGTILSGTGYTCSSDPGTPSAIALGPSTSTPETAWVLSSTAKTVTGIPYGGGSCTAVTSPEAPTGTYPTGWNVPLSIAASDNLFVLDQGQNNLDSFTLGNSSSATWAAHWQGIFADPNAIALDGAGDTWVTDRSTGVGSTVDIYAINSTGNYVALSSAPFGASTETMAVGANQSLWVADQGSDKVFPFSTVVTANSATATTGTPFADPTGGIGLPLAVAVDGVGNAWTVNGSGADIAAFRADGTAALSPNGTAPNTAPYGGYSGNGIVMPQSTSIPTGVAVDPSGDVWLSVQSGTSPVVEFIGMAAPTVTPLADAAAGNKIATRP